MLKVRSLYPTMPLAQRETDPLPEGLLEQVEGAGELRLGDRERRHELRHPALRTAGQDEDAAAASGGHPGAGGLARTQLDAPEQAAAADGGDGRQAIAPAGEASGHLRAQPSGARRQFVLLEQRPRAQSRAHVLEPTQGAFVIFPTATRPNRGKNGYHRVGMRHGVSTVTRGQRTALGVIFHDAT